MAKYQRRAAQRAGAGAMALCLLVIFAVRSECTAATRPSDHGLPDDQEQEPASPAMEAFFQGLPDSAASLPEASNFTGGVTPAMEAFFRPDADAADAAAAKPEATSVPGTPSASNHRNPRRDTRIPAQIAAGVVCGVLGFALLVVAAATAYVVHLRRSVPETEPGSEFALVRKESGSEITMGIP